MQFVTSDHQTAFGLIIYQYAAAESGIKITLAGMLDIRLNELLILSEPYSSVNLRNVATSIAKAHCEPGEIRDQFCQLVGDLGTFGPLRNHIAHSRWTSGQRPGSIRPFGINIRSGTAKYLGRDENERDWTAYELTEEGWKLKLLNSRIVQFMGDTGIIARMEAKDSDSSAAIDASEGISRNAS